MQQPFPGNGSGIYFACCEITNERTGKHRYFCEMLNKHIIGDFFGLQRQIS